MTVRSTVHNHTNLCDGKNTPEEMIRAAIAAGFTDFGISDHSWAGFDGMGIEDEGAYIELLTALKHKYADTINLAIGMEQDIYAPVHMRQQMDYIIGSVHEVKDADGGFHWMDGSREKLVQCIDTWFDGDPLRMAAEYYRLVVENTEIVRPEIIGHFDLVSKNNSHNAVFDEGSSAYRALALDALEACLSTGAILEVNTGGMFRGYRERPYPARFILEAARDMGGHVMLAADAHQVEALTYFFDETQTILREVGFKTVIMLKNGAFTEEAL